MESQWPEMTLCFHSVTAYMKITLRMCIKWQDLGRFGLQMSALTRGLVFKAPALKIPFLEGWEPKEWSFHPENNAPPMVRTVKSLTFGPGAKVHAG